MDQYINIFDKKEGLYLDMYANSAFMGTGVLPSIFIDAKGFIWNIPRKIDPAYGIGYIGQLGDGRYELKIDESLLKIQTTNL